MPSDATVPADSKTIGTTTRFEDGLGVRVATTDAFGEPIEHLKVSVDLAALDSAIRERVSRLINFRHVRYVRLRGTERLTNPEKDFVIAYDAVTGARVSELLDLTSHTSLRIDIDVALQIVRELLPAVAVLHDSRNVTHGAIAPERLVITNQGRLVIVDHGLGLALGKLGYSRRRYWQQLAVAVPPGSGKVAFDARTDVIQIGVVALALILGRPIGRDEYPDDVRKLVGGARELTAKGEWRAMSSELQSWLERMLPADHRQPFTTVREAQQAFESLLSNKRYAPSAANLKTIITRYYALIDQKSGGAAAEATAESATIAAPATPTPAAAARTAIPTVPPPAAAAVVVEKVKPVAAQPSVAASPAASAPTAPAPAVSAPAAAAPAAATPTTAAPVAPAPAAPAPAEEAVAAAPAPAATAPAGALAGSAVAPAAPAVAPPASTSAPEAPSATSVTPSTPAAPRTLPAAAPAVPAAAAVSPAASVPAAAAPGLTVSAAPPAAAPSVAAPSPAVPAIAEGRTAKAAPEAPVAPVVQAPTAVETPVVPSAPVAKKAMAQQQPPPGLTVTPDETTMPQIAARPGRSARVSEPPPTFSSESDAPAANPSGLEIGPIADSVTPPRRRTRRALVMPIDDTMSREALTRAGRLAAASKSTVQASKPASKPIVPVTVAKPLKPAAPSAPPAPAVPMSAKQTPSASAPPAPAALATRNSGCTGACRANAVSGRGLRAGAGAGARRADDSRALADSGDRGERIHVAREGDTSGRRAEAAGADGRKGARRTAIARA